MMLRTVSLRIEDIGRALDIGDVARRQQPGQLWKAGDPIVAARGPARAKDDDVARRACLEPVDELGAQRADRGVLAVVKEVEVVEEPRRLTDLRAQERVDAAVR